MFTYKGQAVKVGRIAEELGVRYVLEGSVRYSGDQVRINAQLIDATTGGHLWAERYDRPLTDVFALQDEVTRQIVAALSLKLKGSTRSLLAPEPTAKPLAYDAFLKGWEHYRLDTPAHYAKALQYFQEATVLDPDYDRAWAAISSIHWKSYKQDWAPVLGLSASEARSMALGFLAIVSDTSLPLAHQVASQIALWRGQFEAAVEAAELAVAYDSSDADNQVVLAEALIYGGAPEKALALLETARRHDPGNEARYAFLQGLAEFSMGNFSAAAISLRRIRDLDPGHWNPEGNLGNANCQPCVLLIATYGHLGRIDAALVQIEKIKNERAGFGISSEYVLWPFKPGPEMERFKEGLRSAGMVE
jgi:tetratricopeptide (TPR) repeat protein